jgi:hypothetical protein
MSEQSLRDPSRRRFRDDDAARILDHAIRLDAARKSGMSVDDLHDIAREIGIAPDSVDDALSALEAAGWTPEAPPALQQDATSSGAPEDDRAPLRARIARAMRVAFIPVVGLVAGGASSDYVVGPPGPAQGFDVGTVLSTLLVGGSVALLLYHWRHRSRRDYQVDLVSLWGGFVVGWLVAHDALDLQSFAFMSGSWLALALFGRWMLSRRPHEDPSDEIITVA